MQTDEGFRLDGTLQPQDVALYLLSRFGLQVDPKTVEQLVFKDLAGRVSRRKTNQTLLVTCIRICPFINGILF